MPKQPSPLQAARDYEREQGAKIPAQARPLFHLTPLVGWMNDPNGFCFYQGAYHLFYQYHPYDRVWGPMHWGHAVSADLLCWTHLPCALAPDTAADAAGCFSGSAVGMPDGRLMLVYTGVQPAMGTGRDVQAQCVAFGDGVDFVKANANPVIRQTDLPDGRYSPFDFRDPKAWRGEDGKLYLVAGNRHEQRQGSALLYTSDDGLSWTFVTELASSGGAYGSMWECPDFFRLDGYDVLVTSPQEMEADGEFHGGSCTMAMLGRYDAQQKRFTREAVQAVDQGLNFYAPQTTLAPDGRRLMIGWLENWETCAGAERAHAWFGRMSLPRELSVVDGRLVQRPVREIERLWRGTVSHRGVILNGEAAYEGVAGRLIDMAVTLRRAGDGCRRFTLSIATDARHATEIRCDLDHGELTFDRSRCGSRRDIVHTRRVPISMRDGRLTLRIIMDKDSVELFIGEGERVLSSLIDTPLSAGGIRFASDGPVGLDIDLHQLSD